jgi:hypothetical protein
VWLVLPEPAAHSGRPDDSFPDATPPIGPRLAEVPPCWRRWMATMTYLEAHPSSGVQAVWLIVAALAWQLDVPSPTISQAVWLAEAIEGQAQPRVSLPTRPEPCSPTTTDRFGCSGRIGRGVPEDRHHFA